MTKGGISAILVIFLLLCTALPAAAVPFTSVDGIISINLPNGNWTEIEDPDHWISLSDGSSLITIQHFSVGDALPEIPTAVSPYVQAMTASVSTQNEIFIAFGYVADSDAAYDIYESLASLRILQYDTKTAAAATPAPARSIAASDFSVSPADMILYVYVSEDDGAALNVRKGFSTKSDILGRLETGTAVQVTGIVQLKGENYGWYKIDFDGGSGYVAADYLTDAAPGYAEE